MPDIICTPSLQMKANRDQNRLDSSYDDRKTDTALACRTERRVQYINHLQVGLAILEGNAIKLDL